MPHLPKISCLTATLDRFDFLKRSIRCFCDQTYPNKEMVIVTEGAAAYKEKIREHVTSLNRTDIRLEFLDGDNYNLGKVRNISIARASGDLICQWDDDDLFHPLRLEIQARDMLEKNCRASFLTDQLQYFWDSGEMFWLDWNSAGNDMLRLIPGTLLMYKDARFSYPESGENAVKGEDSGLLAQIYRNVPIARLSGFGYLYVYGFHAENTFDYDHHRALSAERSVSPDRFVKDLAEFEKALACYPIPRPFSIYRFTREKVLTLE
uniref:Glycosyl transferase family 2 n=1 Tax=Candidatus Kentrum sp. DK TaxID=2126562 RepID=A0A450SWW0_9GAMM|nr:MAG: Glycosyl transferase family 2 [Candidatus Kentron sp. DK]